MSQNNPCFETVGRQAITAQTIASATNTDGTGIDRTLLGMPDLVQMVLRFGNVTASAGTVLLKLQESDDDSTYTDILNCTTTAQTLADTLDNVYNSLSANLRGRKKWIRLRIVTAGTVTGCPIAAAWFTFGGGSKSRAPATDYATAVHGDHVG